MPALAGFWLLTLLLQLPLLTFLAFAGSEPLPLERAVDIPMALFVMLEAGLAFGVIRRMTHKQTERFLHQAATFHNPIHKFDEE